ncbi:Alpha/beta hydrolase [Halomicronema hongdechloris C2206]|uniref:Alpha/beta hydrolase n=1 Tax=Halomicronema hongdechloris C2206 TaxID=1641165 RepID=A0A1Z3HH90_9CYAN|nr:alpha/beta hydrolase [Halomicronema hongdechloris]ASC69645.1 Alpha/beta hydrolase [Halomicronema hongdechloris C2206]
MLQFQPIGVASHRLETSLGQLVYYTPSQPPWDTADPQSPALVFLHSLGGGSSAYEWSQVYPAFAPDYGVIVPDLLGWGQSDHPARDYGTADYCQILTTLLERVTIPPTLVMATSLTAGVVIRLAIQRPDLFRALALVSPSGNSDFGRNYRLSLSAQLIRTPGVDRLVYALGAANEPAVRNFLTSFLFANADRLSQEVVQAYLTCIQQPGADYAALASLKGDISFDLSRYMGQLHIPTAFILGAASRLNPASRGQRLAQLNPTAVQAVYKIAESGALPQLERPAAVVSVLRHFLANHRSV